MTRMKAVLLITDSGGSGITAKLSDLEVPTPGPGELVVEMKACGLCGSDVEKIKGEYTASMPVVGHEAVGVVSSVGTGVDEFVAGDRVFPHHHVPCYECYLCRTGSETMCQHYRSSNIVPGGFSEYFRVPKWNVEKGGVLKLPGGMSFELASLIEPMACCLRALAKCKVMQDDWVLVAGAGPVGLIHALLLQEIGARVVISDVIEERLRFAEKLDVGRVLDARSGVPEKVRSETGGKGADLAIVATASSGAVVQGLQSVRKGGQVCLFGVPPKGSALKYDLSDIYNSEQRILTSYAATETDTKAALRILGSSSAPFSSLITHRFPLARFGEAVEVSGHGDSVKVILVPK